VVPDYTRAGIIMHSFPSLYFRTFLANLAKFGNWKFSP